MKRPSRRTIGFLCGFAVIAAAVLMITPRQRHDPISVQFLAYTNSAAGRKLAVFRIENRLSRSLDIFAGGGAFLTLKPKQVGSVNIDVPRLSDDEKWKAEVHWVVPQTSVEIVVHALLTLLRIQPRPNIGVVFSPELDLHTHAPAVPNGHVVTE